MLDVEMHNVPSSMLLSATYTRSRGPDSFVQLTLA